MTGVADRPNVTMASQPKPITFMASNSARVSVAASQVGTYSEKAEIRYERKMNSSQTPPMMLAAAPKEISIGP